MTRCARLLFVLFGLGAGSILTAGPGLDLPPAEIKRLALAVALVDYPVDQVAFRNLIGLSAQPDGGMSGYVSDPRGMFELWDLAHLPDGSRYRLKANHTSDSMQTTGRYPEVSNAEVILDVPSVGQFVADPHELPLLLASRYKAKMKRDGLTPRQFTEWKTYRRYHEEIMEEISAEIVALHKKRLAKEYPA